MLELTNLNAFFNDNSSAIEKKHRDDAADVKMWKSGKLYMADTIATAIDGGDGYTYLTLMADAIVVANAKLSDKSITLKLSKKSGTSGRTLAVKESIFSVADTRKLDSDECLINVKLSDNDGNSANLNAVVVAKDGQSQEQILEKYKNIFKA